MLHTDVWHSIQYAYITFKFKKSELFFLKVSLPLLLNFFENGPYTSRTKMHLNTVYQPSVIVMPTSLLHPYRDQVNNVNDLVI